MEVLNRGGLDDSTKADYHSDLEEELIGYDDWPE